MPFGKRAGRLWIIRGLLTQGPMELSSKSKIDTAILIAGDSDFVPALRKAKGNAVRVLLFHSSERNEYHKEL